MRCTSVSWVDPTPQKGRGGNTKPLGSRNYNYPNVYRIHTHALNMYVLRSLARTHARTHARRQTQTDQHSSFTFINRILTGLETYTQNDGLLDIYLVGDTVEDHTAHEHH